ncbi:MAG TPA: aspartate aminotransferase family protein [Alphaproteobacteria bacterium]|nr:aspartate aminotransferase family protein [Alphaproteobacteria bacterium]
MISAVMPVYSRPELAFERGEGAYLFSTDGKRYLDFCSGIAVTAFGHAHPHMVKALTEQAAKLWHTSNVFRIPGQERLAQRLVDATFADTVFFTNSGAEAVECGLKMVRKHFDEIGQPERYRVIACNNAFHGRTLATIAAGGQEKLLKGFEPTMDGFDHVAFGNLNEMRAKVGPQTAAILVEPVQGEGGIRAADPEYMRGLRAMCDEFGLLLFLDEVQCGMGRTGKMFAHEWSGIKPDIVAAAKGIGGGFPLGACLATEKAANGMTYGAHGSTYGGNPLAMAVGNAALDILLEPGFLDNVVRMGEVVEKRFVAIAKKHPKVLSGVRGMGLIRALECVKPNTDVIAALRRNGMLTVGGGDNVIRLLPPLTIDESHVEEAAAIIERTCAELEG